MPKGKPKPLPITEKELEHLRRVHKVELEQEPWTKRTNRPTRHPIPQWVRNLGKNVIIEEKETG